MKFTKMTNDSSSKDMPRSQDICKRKALEIEDDKQNSNLKKTKFSLYYQLESESSLSSEKEESTHSTQDYETDFARDTSDTSTHASKNETGSDISIQIEYELDSRSENENQIADLSTDSYSITENIVINIFTKIESEGLADNSDSSSCSIDYVVKSDFRYCAQCKNLNSDPLYPSCTKCFKIRKNKRGSRPIRKTRGLIKQRNNQFSEMPASQELVKMDSGMVSSPNSNGFFEPKCNEEKNKNSSELNLIENKTVKNVEPKGSRMETSLKPQGSSSKHLNRDYDQCNICFERPRDGAMSHGKTQHVYSCYKCALKIFESSKNRCPICNRRITAVYKQY